MSSDLDAKLNDKIDEDSFTLFDRFIYGGLGYGTFCLPTNLFRILFTVIFPPLGVIMEYIVDEFPYVDFYQLFRNLDKVIYALILTMLFYIPGLIYALSIISCAEKTDEEKLQELEAAANPEKYWDDIK